MVAIVEIVFVMVVSDVVVFVIAVFLLHVFFVVFFVVAPIPYFRKMVFPPTLSSRAFKFLYD